MRVCTLLMMLAMACGSAAAQTSFWNDSTTPANPAVRNDNRSVTLGLKFQADVPGLVTGVRFYKGPGNAGTHTGTLWSATGTRLASVTFSGETASGWQKANFSSPVPITANTTYVVAYTAPVGAYAVNAPFNWSNVVSGSLRTASTSAGVYVYGSTPAFPTQTYNSSNYWVDVVFSSAPATSSFWNDSATPGTQSASDSQGVTLGLKFTSDQGGFVTGLRFFKGLNNTGTHEGTLWSGNGSLLARVTFSEETASGWQSASFATPVAIAANTPYVIAYHAPRGGYAINTGYAWSSLSAAPLRVSGSAPGVYIYGASSQFPVNTWAGSNYWVDVMFSGSTTPSQPAPATYTISGIVRGTTGATLTLSGSQSGTTRTDGSGNYSFTGLPNGSYVVAPSQSGFTFSPLTAAVSINGAPVGSINFTASTLPVQRSVTLSWSPSTSPNVRGYNVWRSTSSGTGFSKLTASPMLTTTYVDSAVATGTTYYYYATAVDNNNMESVGSNQVVAVVPAP
jgi:hypothetical protein